MPSPATPPVKPGHVRRTARVFWRAGEYDFPAEAGGKYVMTPDDNRRAIALFQQPVPFDYAHKRGPLDGHLGEVVAIFPASDTGDALGFHADIPEWLDRTYRDERGQPLPLNVSATWDRRTKALKRVALVNEPRIGEAAMFEACFAATGDPAVGAALQPPPSDQPPPPVGMNRAGAIDDDATDPGRTSTLEVEGDDESLALLKQLAERMGCTVEEGEPEEDDEPKETEAPSPATEEEPMPTQVPAAFESRLAALERENRELRRLSEERSRRDAEARFERAREDARRDALAFCHQVVPSRVLPYQQSALVAEFVQAALDDYRHPEEVHFSAEAADGTLVAKKGTRVEALKARYLALPDTGLLGERVRESEEAIFEVPSGRPDRTKADPATVNRILAGSDLGRVVLSRNGKTK